MRRQSVSSGKPLVWTVYLCVAIYCSIILAILHRTQATGATSLNQQDANLGANEELPASGGRMLSSLDHLPAEDAIDDSVEFIHRFERDVKDKDKNDVHADDDGDDDDDDRDDDDDDYKGKLAVGPDGQRGSQAPAVAGQAKLEIEANKLANQSSTKAPDSPSQGRIVKLLGGGFFG